MKYNKKLYGKNLILYNVMLHAVSLEFYFVKGWVDYIGSSHQWWHALVVLALYYWHNTGMLYVEYRMNHGCPTSIRSL